MKVKCFAVMDTKIGAFMAPFFMQTRGAAFRAWQTTANDGQSMISKYPGDFYLAEIGEFDDQAGKFVNYEMAVNLGYASEVATKRESEVQKDMFSSGRRERSVEVVREQEEAMSSEGSTNRPS